jgi:RHS repeat-associated protein
MGWAASPTRKAEQLFTVSIIQMGARVYIPGLGRFAQVDPIEGGTPNSYVYAGDPINDSDYSGMSIWNNICKWVKSKVKQVSAAKKVVTPYISYLLGGGQIQTTSSKNYSWDSQAISKGVASGYSGKPAAVCIVKTLQAKPTDIVGRNVLGTVTVAVGGNLTVKDNNYAFSGKIVGGYDRYNFNRTWGRGDKEDRRDFDKEMLTWGGALGGGLMQIGAGGVLAPQDYDILIEGGASINGSGHF